MRINMNKLYTCNKTFFYHIMCLVISSLTIAKKKLINLKGVIVSLIFVSEV